MAYASETPAPGKVTGAVLDIEYDQAPLAFARVSVKNTGISSTTDLAGAFSLQLQPGVYTLVFDFVGYQTIEVANIHVRTGTTTTCNQLLGALTASPMATPTFPPENLL